MFLTLKMSSPSSGRCFFGTCSCLAEAAHKKVEFETLKKSVQGDIGREKYKLSTQMEIRSFGGSSLQPSTLTTEESTYKPLSIPQITVT